MSAPKEHMGTLPLEGRENWASNLSCDFQPKSVSVSPTSEHEIMENRKKRRIDQAQSLENSEAVDEVTLEGPSIVVVSLNELPAVEVAFSIENIQKIIFAALKPKDWFSCRLVCRQWQQCEILHNLVKQERRNAIYFSKYENNQFQCYFRINAKYEYHQLNELSALIDASGPNRFPCQKYNFRGEDLADQETEFQAFLTKHGHMMHEIGLELKYNQENLDGALRSLLEFVKKLISEQAPNLLQLNLDIKFRIPGESTTPLQDGKFAGNLNLNLHLVQLRGHVPAALFECICCMAPNLEEMDMLEEYFNYFIEPKNRLDLLRDITYTPFGGADFIETIVNMDGPLNLKSFSFFVIGMYGFVEEERGQEVAATFVKILEKSFHSLEHITWSRMGCMAVEIPTLPFVKSLYFTDDTYDDDDEEDPVHYFPEGFRMSVSFPNLETISIDPHCLISGKDNYYFLNNKDDVVPSVKYIETYGDGVTDAFSEWFPNAIVDTD